jgi:hypothetical protein
MSRALTLAALLAISGCSLAPFKADTTTGAPPSGSKPREPGAGPVLTVPTQIGRPDGEPVIEMPPPAQLPRERPKAPPATLSPASRTLVSQAQAQRKKGDLPGATVSLERALRIEPKNPLLWLEMGRLRMDQRNYPQAENMARKALSMSVGDDATQSAAWRLIADSLRARDRNPEAEQALERARALEPS